MEAIVGRHIVTVFSWERGLDLTRLSEINRVDKSDKTVERWFDN